MACDGTVCRWVRRRKVGEKFVKPTEKSLFVFRGKIRPVNLRLGLAWGGRRFRVYRAGLEAWTTRSDDGRWRAICDWRWIC